MHIPDGVLSPSTDLVMGTIMAPVWFIAARQVRKQLAQRQLPLLALGSAFCFTIMMFNVPAPGGTTAHPVGGTLLAILLGPWAAVIGVSTALAIQCLFFGDGGILSFGANCFTMGFVLPMVGYTVYRLAAGKSSSLSPRRMAAAAIGSYVGINAAASIVGLLLGIQPSLFHTASGHALYFPFGCNITIPAMLGAHLTFAGPLEAIATAAVVKYMQSTNYALYGCEQDKHGRSARRREMLLIGLLALAALSPLGLLAQGDAFGEWNASGVKAIMQKTTGQAYIPAGMMHLQKITYHAPKILDGYVQPDKGANVPGYLLAAVIGISVISCVTYFVGKLMLKKEIETAPEAVAGITREEGEKSDLPQWMFQTNPVVSPSKGSSNPFLQRTLGSLTNAMATALRCERTASKKGFLQAFDPRAKVVGLLLLMGAAGLCSRFVPLLVLYLCVLLAARMSGIQLGSFVKRVWLSAPLLVFIIALPAAFSFATPGTTLLVVWHSPYVAITREGLAITLLLTLRVGVTVSLAALLTLTTKWNQLLHGLRVLNAPKIFIALLSMTYRYVALLLQLADEMYVARRSRTIGKVSDSASRAFVSNSIGSLFRRTLAFSDEVYGAMMARGYRGETHSLNRPRWQSRDTVWLIGALVISFAILTIGGFHGSA